MSTQPKYGVMITRAEASERVQNQYRHLLAIVRPKDTQKHPLEYLEQGCSPTDSLDHLLRSFVVSLPEGTKAKLGTTGFINDPTTNAKRVERYFLVVQVPQLDGIDIGYFARNMGTAIFEIPDKLRVTVRYEQVGTGPNPSRDVWAINREGPVEEMVTTYNHLVADEAYTITARHLAAHADFKEGYTQETLLGAVGRRKFPNPTTLTIELRTVEDVYVLATKGPYNLPKVIEAVAIQNAERELKEEQERLKTAQAPQAL